MRFFRFPIPLGSQLLALPSTTYAAEPARQAGRRDKLGEGNQRSEDRRQSRNNRGRPMAAGRKRDVRNFIGPVPRLAAE
jgi:hypothetical protein